MMARLVNLGSLCLHFRRRIHNLYLLDDAYITFSDLEAHRALSQTAFSERETQASHAASLLSLNLKLQSSAVKSRTRHLDADLLALDASQAKDLLQIVQPYLPQVYVETDSDPTNSYLFFARLGKKCEILGSVVGKMAGVEEALWGTTGGGATFSEGPKAEVTDAIVGICEVSKYLSL